MIQVAEKIVLTNVNVNAMNDVLISNKKSKTKLNDKVKSSVFEDTRVIFDIKGTIVVKCTLF